MRRISKYFAAAVLSGGLALVAVTPSQARWHHGVGVGSAIGFAAGATLGALAANSYDNGYYGYGYGPDYGYAYAPDYGYDAYASAGPVYRSPDWRGQTPRGIDTHRGPGCIQSPGSMTFTGCDGN